MSESLVAPVLSTTQDESDLFTKYTQHQQDRTYLNADYATLYESQPRLLLQDIKRYYAVEKLTKFLCEKGYKRITLQFPDSLVADSAIVARLIESGLKESKTPLPTTDNNEKQGCTKSCESCSCSQPQSLQQQQSSEQKVWILADTAYSACCIDSVAAEHVHGDVVVHFGDACLNSIDRLPAIYVFGEPQLNVDDVIEKFKQTYEEKNEAVVLMADTTNSRYLKQIWERLTEGEGYYNLGYLDVRIDKADQVTIIDYESEIDTELINSNVKLSNRQLIAKSFELQQLDSDSELTNYQLFYITEPQPPHLLYLTAKFSSVTLYDSSTSSTSTGPFPSLSKRYRYMHMARTAGTIGILVNTLSLSQTTQMINVLSKQIKEAGKKSHFFVVGKPNVAKLANFESVECWCVVGCAQGGIILDQSNEFYRPIVTPFELGCALGDGWNGGWELEFQNYLEKFGEDDLEENGNKNKEQGGDNDEDDDSESEAPEFDPVTGKYVSTSRPLRQLQHLTIEAESSTEEPTQPDSNALVKKFSSALAIKSTVSTSAQYLQQRHWTGLGSDFKDDEDYDEEGAIVEEGLEKGVARGYGFDVSDMNGKREQS